MATPERFTAPGGWWSTVGGRSTTQYGCKAAIVTLLLVLVTAGSALGRVCEVPGVASSSAPKRDTVSAEPTSRMSAAFRRFDVRDRSFYRSGRYARAHGNRVCFAGATVPIARAPDLGASNGCQLRFEVRPSGTGYEAAVSLTYLHLRRLG